MKVSAVKQIRELEVGASISFPIRHIYSIRNAVSILSTIHFNEGKSWISRTKKQDGLITVTRTN
ncbi:MAG: hypothetical protein ACRCZY_03480 [Phocaeicola sp.]